MFYYFFEFIAFFFLLIFLIKVLNPETVPLLKKAYAAIRKALVKTGEFILYTFKLLVKSSVYTIGLLFTKTIYIIGIDILFSLLLDFIVTTAVYPKLYKFGVWFHIFENNLVGSYIAVFFTVTYIIGLIDYLKHKGQIKTNIFQFFQSKFTEKLHTGSYEYDEKESKYNYRP